MPRKCSVCVHADVEEINRLLAAGEPLRNVSKQFALSPAALFRHKERHLPKVLLQAQAAVEVARADTLLDQVCALRDRALSLLDAAERAGDPRTALAGVREAKGCLELLARLQGDLRQHATINFLVAPQWLSLRTVIIQTLEQHPAAREAVVRALREVEKDAGE
ncbi:MAG: hypothetical protein DDT37_01262 [Firmicutes bacterium]|nr:hypothetical protein [candidate division NPL-UPA2 bacterium]